SVLVALQCGVVTDCIVVLVAVTLPVRFHLAGGGGRVLAPAVVGELVLMVLAHGESSAIAIDRSAVMLAFLPLARDYAGGKSAPGQVDNPELLLLQFGCRPFGCWCGSKVIADCR